MTTCSILVTKILIGLWASIGVTRSYSCHPILCTFASTHTIVIHGLIPRPQFHTAEKQYGKQCLFCFQPEDVGHGWVLLIKMAKVTLIDFSHVNRLLSTFTEVGPQFSNQDSRLGPVIEKLSILQNPRSISVTSAILVINCVRPPLCTPSANEQMKRSRSKFAYQL